MGIEIQTSKKLPLQILISILLGIVAGILFGEKTNILNPIGSIYVMMLQSVVYPYLISSLISGFALMDAKRFLKFFKNAWIIYALLIVLTFLLMIVFASMIPSSSSRILEQDRGNISSFFQNFLDVIVPSNPVVSIVDNFVPAVVVISIFYGHALSYIEKKEAQVHFFEQVAKISLKIWNWVIKFSPIGIFALTSVIAGEIELASLENVAIYIALFIFGALFLTFCILPLLLKSLFPISYKELIENLQNALMVSLVTSLSVVALPFISRMAKAILKRHDIENNESDEIVQTSLAVSYPFCQLGNFFLYLFISFAVFYFHRFLSLDQKIGLPFLSFFSGIGTPSTAVDAAAFLSKWVSLPQESLKLFILLMPITRFPQVLVSVMGMAVFTLLSCLAYFNKLQFQRKFIYMGSALYGSFIILILALHMSFNAFSHSQETSLLDYAISSELKNKTHAVIHKEPQNSSDSSSLSSILSRGILRVGFNADMIPWCYFDRNGELVGFDTVMMYKLASDLDVKLEFIPFEWFSLLEDISNQKFDIAIGSIYVTAERLLEAKFSESYDRSKSALMVKNEKISDFYTLKDIRKTAGLKIAVFEDPITEKIASLNFPKSDIAIVESYQTLPNDFDAGFWTKSHTDAWVTVHSGYTSIVPEGLIQGWPLQLAYLLNKNSEEFLQFLNYWLKIQQSEGFFKEEYDKWINRIPPKKKAKRWSLFFH